MAARGRTKRIPYSSPELFGRSEPCQSIPIFILHTTVIVQYPLYRTYHVFNFGTLEPVKMVMVTSGEGLGTFSYAILLIDGS